MARIFKTPFAAQGDKDTIPTPTQGDGSVSVTQGFGFDYQREYEDPLAKDIRREDMNGILHDITEAVGDIQLTGVAKWSADAAPYPTGAVVWHDGTAWLSLEENNSFIPTPTSSAWSAQRPATLFVEKSANLSDLANVATARTNLGLGNSATRDVGTASGTVAAGNDSRITGAAQKSANLSDLTNTATARANIGLGNNATGRSNLGLGDSATRNVGTTSGTVAAGNDSRITGAAQKSANLSDLTNRSVARTNLGLGSAATRNVTASPSDTLTGRVATVGWMGLGSPEEVALNDGDDLNNITGANRFFSWANTNILNNPSTKEWGAGFTFGWRNGEGLTQIAWGAGDARWYARQRGNSNAAWSSWVEIYHSGNISPVPEGRTIATGTGLTGGGTLAANRTLAIANSHIPIGVGQTWQNMTGARAKGTTYTNTTGRPIMVAISMGDSGNYTFIVNGVNVVESPSISTIQRVGAYVVVPAGNTYRLNTNHNLLSWSELR